MLPDDEDAPGRRLAEVNVMIAAAGSRRGGLGSEAVSLMMAYGVRCLGLNAFVAKISLDNAASAAMFAKLGFVQTARVEAFGEAHYTLDLTDAGGRAAFLERHAHVVVEPYENSDASDGAAEAAAAVS